MKSSKPWEGQHSLSVEAVDVKNLHLLHDGAFTRLTCTWTQTGGGSDPRSPWFHTCTVTVRRRTRVSPSSNSLCVALYVCLSFCSCFSIFLFASLFTFSSSRSSSVCPPRQPISAGSTGTRHWFSSSLLAFKLITTAAQPFESTTVQGSVACPRTPVITSLLTRKPR